MSLKGMQNAERERLERLMGEYNWGYYQWFIKAAQEREEAESRAVCEAVQAQIDV